MGRTLWASGSTSRAVLLPRETCGNIWKHFGFCNLGEWVLLAYWGEVRDAARLPNAWDGPHGNIWSETSTGSGECLPCAEAWSWRAGGHRVSLSIRRELPPACPAPLRGPHLVSLESEARGRAFRPGVLFPVSQSFRGARISLGTPAAGKMGDDK